MVSSELSRYGESIIDGLYGGLLGMAKASELKDADGNVTASLVGWVTVRENAARQQLADFMKSLSWASDKKPSWASRAVSNSIGVSIFDDSVDTRTRCKIYINDLLSGVYETDKRAYENISGSTGAMKAASQKPFAVNIWFAAQEYQRYLWKTEAYGHLFAAEWDRESVLAPLDIKVRDHIFGLVSVPFSSYSEYKTKVDHWWSTEVLQWMMARQNEIREKGNVLKPTYPLPEDSTSEDAVAQYRGIKDLVRRAGEKQSSRGEDTYLQGSAFILYDLGIDCQGVELMLHQLNVANPFIPMEERRDYEMVYQHVLDYQKMMCNGAKPVKVSYEEQFNMFSTYINDLLDKVDEVWDEYLKGYWDVSAQFSGSGRKIYKLAADKGLIAELETKLSAAKENVKAQVTRMEESTSRGGVTVDPWKGPLLMRGDGIYVPLNGFKSGGALYLYWIRNLVGTEFYKIYAWIDGAEASPDGVFRVTESLMRTELESMWGVFDGKLGGTTNASVLDEAWAKFKAWAADTVGKVYESYSKFTDEEFRFANKFIADGQKKKEKIESSNAMDIPVGFDVYEEKYKNGVIDNLPTMQLEKDFEVVSSYNTLMPSDYDSRMRYENVYKAYSDALDLRGGDRYEIVTWDTLNGLAVTIADQVRSATSKDRDLLVAVYGNAAGLDSMIDAYQSSLVSKFSALAGKSLTVSAAYRKMMAMAGTLGAGLNAYIASIPGSCEKEIDNLIAEVKGGDVSEAVREKADRIITGFSTLEGWSGTSVFDKVATLARLLRKKLGAGLKPFMTFYPMKGRGAFELEEFAMKDFQSLMDKWAAQRLRAGIFVEPKIDGYRAVLESFGGKRKLFLEGGLHDLLHVYPELDEDLGDVILDGELVGELDGKVAPRIESGTVERGRLDVAVPLLYVFDILYLDGKDLHDLPYSERRKVLSDYFNTHKLEHVRELPAWMVSSRDELRAGIDRARSFDGSEGAMLKESTFAYVLGGKTLDWAKVKRSEDVHVVVLSREENKSGTYNYECGVGFYGEDGIDPDHVKSVDGVNYMVLGKTFGSNVKFSVGDKIEVAVTKVIRRKTDNGVWYEWQDPRVKCLVERNPDTISQIGHVSQLLGASISRPYRFLMDLYDKSMTATSVDVLNSMHTVAEALFNELHYPRLRRIALMVLVSIEDRITPSGRPGDVAGKPGTPSGERGETAGHVVVVTERLVQSIKDTFDNVRNSITMLASEKHDRAENLLASLRQMAVLASGGILDEINALKQTVEDYLDMMGSKEDVSHAEILKELARMESRVAAAAGDLKDPNREKTAYDVQDELNKLMKKITTTLYDEQVGRIQLHIEEILSGKEADAKYYGTELLAKISQISDRIDTVITNLHDNPSDFAKTQLRNVYQDLKQLIVDMGTAQLKAYGGQTDELMNKILEAWPVDMPMPIFLGGASPVVGWSSKLKGMLDDALGIRGDLSDGAFMRLMEDDPALLGHMRRDVLEEFFSHIDDVNACPDLGCIEEIVREAVKVISRKYEQEAEEKATDERPLFQWSDGGKQAVWATKIDPAYPEAAQAAIREGKTVLLVGSGTDWRIAAIRDANGTLLSGNPDIFAEGIKQRAHETIESDRYAKEVRSDFGESGVEPLKKGVDKAISGVAQVGSGNGFYGGVVDGEPFFVTTAHGSIDDPNEPIILADGTRSVGRLLWRESGAAVDNRERAANDIAIYVVDDPKVARYILDNMTPLVVDPVERSGWAMAIAPAYGGEVDIVSPEDRGIVDVSGDVGAPPPGWDRYAGLNRARGGYSGAPVVNTNGHVVGMWNMSTGSHSYGMAVGAERILEAYRKAGLVGGEMLSSSVDLVKLFASKLGPFVGEPVKVPVRGVLYDVRSKEGGKVQDVKEFVFDWRSAGDTAIVVDIGGPTDEGKLLKYRGGKLKCRVGKPLSGDRGVISGVEMLPSRMKTAKTGERYYEMYLKFDRLAWLNGLWGISEKAGESVGVEALMFRLDGLTPFWARDDAKHRRELGQIPAWQRPSFVAVKQFYGGKDGSSS